MRPPLLVFIIASFCLSLAPLVRADSTDPGEIFLSAYMSAQEADKLENQGNFKGARAKLRFAGSVLDQLQLRSPDWNPLVVEFRKKKVAEALQKLEDKIAQEAPPLPPPTVPKQGLDTTMLPGINDPAPRTGTSEGGGDAFDRAAREMRAQMETIKQQLEKSREQLQATQREKERIANKLEEATNKLKRPASLTPEQAAKLDAANAEAAQAKEQEAALRKQLAKSQESEAALKAQIARTASDVSDTKSKIERNTGDQQTLQAQLDEAKAEAAKVKAQLSKAQASETDLQAKLEETRKQVESQGQEKAQAQTEALKKQMEKLRNALEDAKADREIAEEQGQLIYKRTAKLAKERAESESRTKQLTEELAEVQKKAAGLAATEAKLAQVTKERDDTKVKNTQLTENLADVEKKLIAMAQEREAAKTQAATATKELEETKKVVVTVTAERDNALAQLAKAKDAKEQVEKLLAENASLITKLDEAQKTIASLNASAPEKDQQIAALKTQIATVQDQLNAAKKEGIDNRILIADLQTQLDETTAKAAAPAGEDQKKLSQENELLRGIVLRELKEQARREQSRKLIVSELDRLQVRSTALTSQIDLLSQPTVKLTDTERALFKLPQMEIIDDTPGAMAISITAPATGSPTPAAPEKEAKTVATDQAAKPAPAAVDGELPSNGPATAAPSRNLDSSPKVATENRPNVPPELQELAKDARDKLNRGQYIAAERVYEKIVSQAPKNIVALSNLGVARFRAGHLKLAEETFKKVLALSPDDAFARYTLGIVYFQQGKYNDAITSLTQSVAANPKNAMAHNYLGIAAEKKGWSEAALKEFQTAVEIDPNFTDAHYNLAVLIVGSDKEGARVHYKKALELGMAPNADFEASLK